jgi:integrase
MWKGPDGKPRQKVTPATTKSEALRIARDKEQQAWRQREGLEPMPTSPLVFGELLDWWREEYRSGTRAYSTDDFLKFVDKHLAPLRDIVLVPAIAGDFSLALDRLLKAKEKAGELAPRSLNHLRSAVFNMFERARDPKHRKWTTENPVRWVDRFTPGKRARADQMVLRRDEVPRALAALPEPSLAVQWRWVGAVCLYTGARPGEAMGLHKADVDTQAWLMTICRSWDQPLPKDEEPRVVVIPPELRAHLTAAMAVSPSERVFCRPDGSPYDPSIRQSLVDRLRRALGRAGIVDGYRHTCRRKGCGFQEARPIATESRCPRCNMRLWVSPIPRPLRFYDLRHTNGTLLRKAGVDLGAVQKSLGHSSPDLTAAVYDHSGVEDFRAEVERALSFGEAEKVNATSMQVAEIPKNEAPGAVAFANNSGA